MINQKSHSTFNARRVGAGIGDCCEQGMHLESLHLSIEGLSSVIEPDVQEKMVKKVAS